MSDRESTLLGEHGSNRKETYSTLYKNLQPEANKIRKKTASYVQYDTPKIQFPFQKSPMNTLESPQVQLQSIDQHSSEKKLDPVIRADLFGTYPELDNRASDFRLSNAISGKSGSQQITFQHRTQSNMAQVKHSLIDDGTSNHQAKLTWTGQYGEFLMQIEKMKRELETIGDENLELANLITQN